MDQHYQGAPGPDPMLGQTIGNYRVSQKLGEGGMGSVYMAEHPHIGKKVALKILHAEFASNPDVVARFFNEAKAVNDIGHPNIVDIIDYGVLTTGPNGEGLVYFIMEFLPGATLSDLIRREAPLAPERALSITLQVADALSASHKAQIVHRDLKPDNIILIQRGREKDFVKLLDFGIAKLTGDQPGSRRTRTGLVMGTPAYMSPEQCEGRGNVDHRADVYALGIVLYEMITGRVPFYGEGYGEVLVQHLTQAPPPPSTIRGLIPPHVEQVILKALEKRPEMRFPTMDEMSKALMDPVGYVEAHGGIAGFLASNIVPSNDPVAPVSRMTPSAIAPLTPVPGTLTTPTTLGGSAGQQVAPGGAGSKKGLFIGVGVAVAAAAVAAIVLLSGGGGGKQAAAGDDTGSEQGSAEGTGDKPGTGAATDPGTGSAAGTDSAGTGTAGAGTGTGSDVAGTGTGSGPGRGATEPGPGTGASGGTGAGDGTGSAAEAPAEITVRVTSKPAGAFVTFGDETKPRGKTPFTTKVPKSDDELVIDIELPGYHDLEKKVKLNGDVDLEVALKKRSGGSGTGSGTGKGTGKGKSNCTDADLMDPFSNCK
jgi:serine/threonine-protein kinase